MDGSGAPRRIPVLAVVFGALGLGLLAFAVQLVGSTREFVERSETATGTVVGMERGRDAAYPVVRFETRDGRTITFRNRVGGNPPGHRVGDTVPVRYDPARPERAAIDTVTSLWLGPILVGGVGVLLSAIALGAIARGRGGPRRIRPGRAPGTPAPRSDRGLPRR